MVNGGYGFCFECRKDTNGSFGVLEDYKIFFRNNEQNVKFTCAVDSSGNILIPAVMTLSEGFKPLLAQVPDPDESLMKFVRSNKPVFAKIGEFTLIASGSLVYDMSTGAISSNAGFKLYVPRNVLETCNVFKNNAPVLVCDELAPRDGVNTYKVSSDVYDAYIASVTKKLTMERMKSKFDYLRSFF